MKTFILLSILLTSCTSPSTQKAPASKHEKVKKDPCDDRSMRGALIFLQKRIEHALHGKKDECMKKEEAKNE